jgi:hypothetical protein
LKKVEKGYLKSREFAEGRGCAQKMEAEMEGLDKRFDTSLYSFESVSGAETICEIGVSVGASENAKEASEGFVVKGSITDRRPETEKEDIMRWERG